MKYFWLTKNNFKNNFFFNYRNYKNKYFRFPITTFKRKLQIFILILLVN